MKVCVGSKGTACALDACRDKCVENKDFVCKWYAHDPAKNDCYLYETCTNEAADPDYTQYLLVPKPVAVAGATLSTSPVPIHHARAQWLPCLIRPPQYSRPPPAGCVCRPEE